MKSILVIIQNIVGGAITVGLIELGRLFYRIYWHHNFKSLFGNDLFSSDGFHITYAKLLLPPLTKGDGSPHTHPYLKPGEESSGISFSIENPVSSCELRAAKYLAEVMGKEAKKTPLLTADLELRARVNISFISIGGPASNYKSRDVLNNEKNNLIVFDDIFRTPNTRRPLVSHQGGFDYGLILKLNPNNFLNRVWLTCAGYGEWGSSGAAWYLAHKWREIVKFADNKPFCIITKVKIGQDESAEPIVWLRSPYDAESYADKIDSDN